MDDFQMFVETATNEEIEELIRDLQLQENRNYEGLIFYLSSFVQ